MSNKLIDLVDSPNNEPTFKLINFSPIGFKYPNYPVKICLLCRGSLIEVCNRCSEKGEEKCNVMNLDNAYYHQHCYNFINDTKK